MLFRSPPMPPPPNPPPPGPPPPPPPPNPPPPAPPPDFNTEFIWPNGKLTSETQLLRGTTADGLYVASASSNSQTAYRAFSADPSMQWASSNAYSARDGSYIGYASTNGVRGEWVQLVFPEPFRPDGVVLVSNGYVSKLFGSTDRGGTWNKLMVVNGSTNCCGLQYHRACKRAEKEG